MLEAAGLAPASVNVRLSAIRKLAAEAADNGGPPTKPLAYTPIYEFDAVVSGDRVALVATTAAGITVATGPAAKFRIAWSSTVEAPVPVALLSPAVALSASGATTIAAFAGLGTP